MERRVLPGTDLEVSVVGLGCWAMGGERWGADVRDEDSAAAVEAALDAGVNLFDTAPLYGRGHADEVLTRALGERRREAVIATKVGARFEGEHAISDLSPEHLRADAEASLKRLRLERIPLLQIHWPCELGTPLADSLGTLMELVAEGKVAHLGVCNFDARQLAEARALAPVVSLQTPYSMVRRAFERALLPGVLGNTGEPGVGVLAYEPLCRGLLTGKWTERPAFSEDDLRATDDRFRPEPFARIARLAEGLARIGRHFDASAAAVAIAWAARRRGVTSVLAGAKRPGQVLENVDASRLLDEALPWDVLDRMAATVRL